MIDLILLGVVVILLNVLDSVTTELVTRLPEHLRSKEANPFMRAFLKNHPIPSHILKQVAVIGIVVYIIATAGDMELIAMRVMVILAVMLGLVVINNGYIWIGRKITKRKIHTPFYKACKMGHIPENCLYFVWVALTVPVALAIAYLLF